MIRGPVRCFHLRRRRALLGAFSARVEASSYTRELAVLHNIDPTVICQNQGLLMWTALSDRRILGGPRY